MAMAGQGLVDMAAPPSPLPNDTVDWEPNLTFNEDECRDFLNEVGEVVVNSYIFSMGMEEAYTCIWRRYGPHGTSDAISLLHEILEEDDVVGAGLGLESDIWRPWKKNFRLRNINPHNPWMPHIGTRFLPPATPIAIRKIRAQNFLKGVSASSSVAEEHATGDGPTTSNLTNAGRDIPSLTLDGAGGQQARVPAYAHQRYRTLFQMEDDVEESPPEAHRSAKPDPGQVKHLSSIISRRPTISSTASISGVRPQSAQPETLNLDPAVALAWLALTAGQQPSSAKSGGGDDHIPTLRSVRYIPGSESAESQPVLNKEPNKAVKETEETDSKPPISAPQTSPIQQDPSVAITSANARRSLDLPEVVEDPEYQSAARDRQCPAAQEIQHAHRHATLLAGEIRTPVTVGPSNRARDSLEEANANGDNGVQQTDSPKSKTAQVSVSETKFGKRKSRTARLLDLFGVSEKKERTFLPGLRRSFSIKSNRSGLCFLPSSSPSPTRQPTRARARPMTIAAAYDGACSPRSTISSGHLNKPLPLSPADRVQTSLSHSQSCSPSRPRSSNFNPPLTASTTSTQATRTSSKQQFRQATRDLLRAEEMEYAPSLPMNEDGSRSPASRLEPRKFEQGPYSPWFTNIARSNPFTDKPVFVSQEPPRSPHNNARHYKFPQEEEPPMPSLPSSRSEPNFNDLSLTQLPSLGPNGTAVFSQTGSSHSPERSVPGPSQPGSSSSPEHSASCVDESRGRARARPQTPHTENQSSVSRKNSPPKPAKRSQSPVKRLLGFGKSTPSKDTKPTVSSMNAEPTPGSSAKRSLKEWSYKIKHGFLAPDQDEEERENNMEVHNSSKPAPKVLPPSTFPISLDPSYQARLQADLELMLVITANRFLVREAQENRISRFSINKFRRDWESKNLPQVIEYQFDMATQRGIILDNLGTVDFCGQIADDPVALTAALHAWGLMANEMRVRTFCVGDSVIRKWLNDSQRILEMLGAPYITFSMFDKMSTKALLVINQRQRVARAQDASSEGNSTSQPDLHRTHNHCRNASESSYAFRPQAHKRSASDDSYIHGLYGGMAGQLEALHATPSLAVPYAQAANPGFLQGANVQAHPERWVVVTPVPSVGSQAYEADRTLPRDAYENSRGGRLGLMRNATPAIPNNPFARQSPSRAGVREI